MKTVFGMVCDQLGVSAETTLEQGTHGPEIRMSAHATPATEFRHVQPPWIGIDTCHDENYLGEVIHLERDRPGRLWAVGHANIDPPEWLLPLFWSAKTSALGGVHRHDIELQAIALTPHPRQVGLRQFPLVILDGKLDDRGRWSSRLAPWQSAMLERASAARSRRKPGEPIVITDEAPVQRNATASYARSGRLEVRSAVAVEVRSRALREVDMIIAPAEQPTTIHERTRSYTEVFSHGCFAGCEAEPARVKVNRDHERGRLIGRAIRLDAWAEEGLVGTVKLARTADADEALALIDDGLLGVSAGFAVALDGEEWRGDHRRIRQATLHHVAVCGDPAYVGAEIVGVRSALALR